MIGVGRFFIRLIAAYSTIILWQAIIALDAPGLKTEDPFPVTWYMFL